ncbi:MAG: D-glycero-beta-D-manno-heptose-7-phosphate kinase [Verrucomicrobiae bacterium]|nr:D-glycero-beta-D-manno-heptose-7-phosphate kinase [Verrucomicrobiae bacterium]
MNTAIDWEAVLQGFNRLRILVIGDVMLDQYLMGKVSRISPEAPVPVVDVQSEKFFPGGASNVARNLRTLTAQVAILGVVGGDASGRRLTQVLRQRGIQTKGLFRDPARPTTLKTRIIAQHQQMVRFDKESRQPLPVSLKKRAVAFARKMIPQMDAVVFEDYGKGVLDQEMLDICVKTARKAGVLTLADPNVHHWLDYRGLTGVTPNRMEAFWMAKEPQKEPEEPLRDQALLGVGRKLLRETKIENVLITLGEQGMCLFCEGETPHHIPTAAREVFDVSGAGDTAISTFALGLCAGLEPQDAAGLSNLASGIVVGKAGTATVTPRELLASIVDSRFGKSGES